MENIKAFLAFLHQKFEPQASKMILSSLPRERLLWNKVLEPGFAQIMLACFGTNASLWTPAGIALVATYLEENEDGQEPEIVAKKIDGYLKKYKALKGSISSSLRRDDLSTSLKIAYLIRYQFDVEKNYHFLSFLSLHTTQTTEKELSGIWYTVFTLLDSILGDANEVYRTILKNMPTITAIRLIIHAILTQPKDEMVQRSRFVNILNDLPLEVSHPFLRELSHCFPNLSLDVVIKQLLPDSFPPTPQVKNIRREIPNEQLLSFAIEEQRKADNFGLRGEEQASLISLKDVKRLLTQALHATDVQLLRFSSERKETLLLENQYDSAFESILISKNLTDLIEIGENNPGVKNCSTYWLKYLQLGEEEKRSFNYEEVSQNLISAIENESDLMIHRGPIQFLFDYKQFQIGALNILVRNGQLERALEAAELFYRSENYSPEYLDFLYRNHYKNENMEKAKLFGELFHVLKIDDVEVQMVLGKIAQREGEWQAAYQYNQSVISRKDDCSVEDWLMMATSAFKVGETGVAMECCHKVVNSGYECAEVHTLKGMIFQAKGEMESALMEYDQAIEIDSKDDVAWKAMADFYIDTNRKKMAFNVLQNALEHVPDNLVLLEMTGDLYIESSDLHQAIEQYKKVIETDPLKISSAEKLCACLWDVQQYSELENILEKNGKQWADSKSVQYYLAKLLLFKHNIDAGLNALEKSIDFEEVDEINLRLYVTTMVSELGGSLIHKEMADFGDRIELFSKTISFLIEQYPDEFELRLINAEFLLVQGLYIEAKKELEALTKYYEANLPDWKWRIQAGIGSAALSAGLPNVAMAALQMAVNVNGDEIKLEMMLAEATYYAKLEPQALVIAEKICERARINRNTDALIWYIDFLIEAGESTKAIELLNDLIAETPDQKLFYLKALEISVELKNSEQGAGFLEKLENFDDLNSEELEFLAIQYESFGEYSKAEAYYTKIYDISESMHPKIQLKRYQLCMIQKYYSDAYDRLNELDSLENFSLLIQVLKADALIFAGNYALAQTILQQIIEEPGNWQKVEESKNSAFGTLGLNISEEELTFHQSPEGIYLRLAIISRLSGDMADAQASIEKAFAFGRENPLVRYCYVVMTMATHRPQRIKQLPGLLKLWTSENSSSDLGLLTFANRYEDLLSALRCELYLKNTNRVVQAKTRDVLQKIENHGSRYQLLQARVAFLDGEYDLVDEYYAQVDDDDCAQSGNYSTEFGICSVFNFINADDPWWIWGELALGHWNKAWKYAQAFYLERPEELRRMVMLVLVGSEILLNQLLMAEIGVVSHHPDSQIGVNAMKALMQTIIEDIDLEAITEEEHLLVDYTSKLIRVERTQSSVQGFEINKSSILRMALQLSRSREMLVNLADLKEKIDLDDRGVLHQVALSTLNADIEKSVFYAKRALSIAPGDPVSRIIYAMAAEKNGDNESALQAIESALMVWPDEWNWHEWASVLAEKTGDKLTQINHQELLCKQFTNDHDMMLNLAEAYLNSGSTHRALVLLNNAADFVKELMPNSLNALYVIAFFQGKHYDQALEYLEQVVCEEERSVNAYLAGVEIYIEKEEYNLALELAQKTYEFNPLYPRTLLLLAKILIHEGHIDDAESLLRQMKRDSNANPDFVVEYLTLLKLASGEETYHQELFDTDEKVNAHPEVLYMKAKEMESGKDFASASTFIQQALQKDASNPKYHALAGSLAQELGQLDQGAAHFTKAINLFPENPDLYLKLAKIQMTQREIGKALETYHCGLKYHQDDFRLYYESALLLRENKQYQEAEYMFKQALSLQPSNKEIRNQLSAVMALNFVHNPLDLRH